MQDCLEVFSFWLKNAKKKNEPKRFKKIYMRVKSYYIFILLNTTSNVNNFMKKVKKVEKSRKDSKV